MRSSETFKKVRVAARSSDLARLQAYRVGDALRAVYPSLDVKYSFRESLGDRNLADPLWQMPEKGVFTEDFVRDLHEGTADVVVHSWKDLPTEERPGLRIAATLPRADQRDLLLFKKSVFETVRASGRLTVLTSSPRRAYNLNSFFRSHLPFVIKDIVFESVRGNIPTRLRKMLSGDGDGLVVAKAAIDRILESTEAEFSDARDTVRRCLQDTLQMVLPLSANPTAAAQGALAIEIRSDRPELTDLMSAIHDAATFAAVQAEREILSSYGGGCHQKIGVSVVDRFYGRITYLQGLTDAGESLATCAFDAYAPMPTCEDEAHVFPRLGEESRFFERFPLPRGIWSAAEKAPHLFVARETAWPDGFRQHPNAVVVTAGLKTWKQLASRGVWVTGSTEGLGESELKEFTTWRKRLGDGAAPDWVKLTHESAAASQTVNDCVATYRLRPISKVPALAGRTHFYWMSGSTFDRALELNPGLDMRGVHASGPGQTHEHLKRRLPASQTPFVYLNVEQFRRAALLRKDVP